MMKLRGVYLTLGLSFLAMFAVIGQVQAVEVTYTYDKLNRLTSATYVDGETTSKLNYSYDSLGNIISETSVVSNVIPDELLGEEWETGQIDANKWQTFGSPAPQIVSPGHTSTYALHTNGAGSYFSGVYSQQSFTLSEGLILDFWLKGHTSSRTTHMRIIGGICDNSPPAAGGYLTFLVFVQLDSPNMPSPGYTYIGAGQYYFEPYVDDEWHKLTIKINTDGTVSFYRDDVHKFTTTSAIDFNQFNSQRIQFASSWSGMYVDDISVQAPQKNAKDELVLDYGALYGLWHYDQAAIPPWTQLTPSDPDQMNDQQDELVANFPGYGLWIYEPNNAPETRWTQISTFEPDSMIRFGNGVACDYAASGLWAWTHFGSWQQLTPSDPDQMVAVDIDNDQQDELVANFPGYGLWIYEPNNAPETRWTQISTFEPDSMIRFGNGLACDYASSGLWAWTQVGSWQQLTPSDPDQMVAVDVDNDQQDELVANFPGYGLWIYEPNNAPETRWTQISTFEPDSMIRFGNGVACDYAASGLWAWTQVGSWQQLTPSDPGQMVAVDIDKDGLEELAVCFSGYGVWVYDMGNPPENRWTQLNTIAPENMIPVDFFP